MRTSYDLTTVDGFKIAISHIRATPIVGSIFSEQLWLLEKTLGLAEKLIDVFSPAQAVEKQAQAVSDLIKAGKQNGVKKMTITMDEQAGIHIESPIEGAKLNFLVGSKGKTKVEVEYS